MIYFNEIFENYEEFKQLFGEQEHGNGEKSRRNRILLQMLRSKEYFRLMMCREELIRSRCVYDRDYDQVYDKKTHLPKLRYYAVYEYSAYEDFDFRSVDTMDLLRSAVIRLLSVSGGLPLHIPYIYGVRSYQFRNDDLGGLCEDKDVRSVRYINVERDRVFKMRAGKFLRKVIEEHEHVNSWLPESVKIWVCEDFAENWKAHALNEFGNEEYELHIDKNFEDIYSSSCCLGDFGSCMVDDGYWTFYRNSVKAHAAYLTNQDGDIVSRCIIYDEVHDDNGKVLRLAERQYATDGDESLKRMLVLRLIDAKAIDGYKRVGADCHSPRAFVNCEGNPLEDYSLWIDCNLEDYDTVSYQDTFKYYDEGELRAYNYGDYDNLSVTGGEREDDHSNDSWSSFNYEYIPEDEACYVDTREDYFWPNQVVEARVRNYFSGGYRTENCFIDDCIEIRGEYYYAGDDTDDAEHYGIYRCPECDEFFTEEDCWHSDITDEDYCCESCMTDAEDRWREENGWVYSEHDDEWFENEEDVIKAMRYNGSQFLYRTISVESFNDLVEEGMATEFCGNFYIDTVGMDGEPVHLLSAAKSA